MPKGAKVCFSFPPPSPSPHCKPVIFIHVYGVSGDGVFIDIDDIFVLLSVHL